MTWNWLPLRLDWPFRASNPGCTGKKPSAACADVSRVKVSSSCNQELLICVQHIRKSQHVMAEVTTIWLEVAL
jgi:hypothetical protein